MVFIILSIIILVLLDSSSQKHRIKGNRKRKEKYFRGYSVVGQDVLLPCSVCTALLHEYITECIESEINNQPILRFNEFCDHLYQDDRKKIQKIQGDYCNYLGHKFDSNYDDQILQKDIDTHNICRKFQYLCDNQGGGPQCYSGFCDIETECIDCPMGPAELDMKVGLIEPVVCGGTGKCKLGWKNQKMKGGNGYCECEGGTRGLACQYKPHK